MTVTTFLLLIGFCLVLGLIGVAYILWLESRTDDHK